MAYGAQAAAAGERLFVTKIPQSVTREDITTYFSRFGTTTDVYVPSIPGSQTHKGIAFVSFADSASVQLSMGHCPHEINGYEVVVDMAAPREGGGGKGGGHQVMPSAAPQYAEQAQVSADVGEVKSGDRLFVTKVSPALNQEHLREYFAQYGDLTDVYMPAVPGSTTHKGICFVAFADPMSCQGVLLNGPHEIQGFPVVVDVASAKGDSKGKGKKGKADARPSAAQAFGGGHQAIPGGGHDAGYAAGFAAGRAAAAGGPQPHHGGMGGVAVGTPGRAGDAVPGRLFITRVNPEVTKMDLQAYFQQFGELQDVFVPNGKGIAFVSFIDGTCAQRVLQNPQHEVKPGQTVVCDQAVDRPGGKGGGKNKSSPY